MGRRPAGAGEGGAATGAGTYGRAQEDCPWGTCGTFRGRRGRERGRTAVGREAREDP